MYCAGVNLDRLGSSILTSVVLRTDLHPSEAQVVLTTEAESTTLRLSGVVYARVDLLDPDGDLVDEVVVRVLPKDGSWPAEAAHLLHHHTNRAEQFWLRVVGPSEVEIVAETFDVV
jgi:hypothetical protein